MENLCEKHEGYKFGCEFAERVASLSLNLCAALVSAGASVGLSESFAARMCAAYSLCGAEVAALPSHVQISVRACGVTITQLKRIYGANNDLSLLEDCSRVLRLAEGGAELEEVEEELGRALMSKPSRFTHFGGGLACGSFCAFFGGSVSDALICFIVGLVTAVLSSALSKRGSGGAARTLLLSAAGGALSLILCHAADLLGIGTSPSLVILGSIMTVIPGLQLCNALRDLLSGDLLSGAYRILGGLAATAAIVAGYAFSRVALGFLGTEEVFHPRSGVGAVVVSYITCAVGSAGFCLMFNARAKRVLSGAFAALLTYSLYLLALPAGAFICTFISAFAAYVQAYAFAQVYKIPWGVFLTPAVVALLPGASHYYAAEYSAAGDFGRAAFYGADCAAYLAAIAAGLSAAAVVLRILSYARSRVVAVFLRKNTRLHGK